MPLWGLAFCCGPACSQCNQHVVAASPCSQAQRTRASCFDTKGGRTCWLLVTPSRALSPFSSLFLGPGMWPDVPRATAGVLRALLPACTGITVAPFF